MSFTTLHRRSGHDTDHSQGLAPSVHDPQVSSVRLSVCKGTPRVGAEGTQSVRTSTSVKADTSVSGDGPARSDISPVGDPIVVQSPVTADPTVVDRAAHTHMPFVNGSALADRHEISNGLTQNPSMTLRPSASEGSVVVFSSANIAPTSIDAPRGEVHVGVQTDARVTVMTFITSPLVERIVPTKRANPLLCAPRLRTIDLPFVGVEQQTTGSPVFGDIGIKPHYPSQQSPVSLLFTEGKGIGDMFRDSGNPLTFAPFTGITMRGEGSPDPSGFQSLAFYPPGNSLLFL